MQEEVLPAHLEIFWNDVEILSNAATIEDDTRSIGGGSGYFSYSFSE